MSRSSMLPLGLWRLLLLSLFPKGADLTCSPMLNPLIMDAPKMMENGTQVSANCSTTEEDFQEMNLCLGNVCCENPLKDPVVRCAAPASGLEMKAECKIKLNDTLECNREHEISMYTVPDVVLSIKDENAKQADYKLQCDVFSAVPGQNFSVTWYKNNETLKTGAFLDSGEDKHIIYVLTVNISREEKRAEFRCEVLLKPGEEKTHLIISATHIVSARYAPELRTNSSKCFTVPKDGDATLICEVEGNPPVQYKWTVDEQSLLETTRSLDITQVNSSSNYSCTATNILGNITMLFYVDVKEDTTMGPGANAPENCGLTLTPSKLYVKYGENASIQCSSSSPNVETINWEYSCGSISRTPTTVIWWIEKLEDFNVKPICYVNLHNNTQCFIKPKIILYKLPDLLTVSVVGSGSLKEGEERQLLCDLYNVAPASKPRVKWYKGDATVLTVDSSSLTPHHEYLDKPIVSLCNVSSVYTFNVTKSDDGALFRCEAEFQLGPGGPPVPPSVASEPYTTAAHYKPTIRSCPSYAHVENNFSLHNLSCETEGKPTPEILWSYNGSLVDSFKLLQRNESGTYKATIQNSMGQVNIDVDITVEYVPSFSCQKVYEVKEDDAPTDLCEPEGLPHPIISWFKNGTEIAPQDWKKRRSGNYSLKASNKHGTAEHMFYLDVLYPPGFTEPDTTVTCFVAGDVSLVWNAEGNPKPEINCNYRAAENVQWTTVGRQTLIIITRATSTNAGEYKCVARNKVGNVTRTSTLLVTDGPIDISAYWWCFVLTVLILLAILAFIYCIYTHRRHGRYSFVENNDRGIPLQPSCTVENGTHLVNGENQH